LFFVFGFCPGGELAFHLKNIGRLTENQGKFYFAEIFTAIEYLHKNNVIFNNLKAENIMLDIDGHIKLVDFSKASARLWEDSITFTLGAARDVGFDELQEEKSRDYLSIGSFLYELLTSNKPDLSRLTFPKYLSENCVSILSLLLLQPSNVTFEEIKNHNWCQGIDWQKISRKRGSPPFRPNFKRSNFPHFDMKNINIMDSSYEEYIRGFDFMTKEIEKCFSNIGEMVLESNVTSERNSTDAEDTFNTLASLRSFNNSSRLDNLDGSQSFLMQRNVTKDERKSSFKSVSPVERNSRFFSLKRYFGEVSGLKRLFKEDMPRAENLNELIQSDGKMREVLRKKIVNIK
jgi:serine/threonine protein kinase